MNYKDYYSDLYEYKWIVTSDGDMEFLQCAKCRAEAPLHDFGSWFGSWQDAHKPLCQICSRTTSTHVDYAVIANQMLRQLGAFDENEVITIDEAGLTEWWGRNEQ